MPIEVPEDAPIWNDTFEAKYVTRYLENYVDKHTYNGRSLRERYMFDCRVDNVNRDGDLWTIEAKENRQSVTFTSRKLVITTGLLSEEVMPSITGSDIFKGHLYHHKHFGRTGLINDPDMKDVTILGGGKSAADLVYAFAKAKRNISWVIRTTGTGAPLLTPSDGIGTCLNAAEVAMTRLSGILTPSPFIPYSWLQWFIHSSRLGESLLSAFFTQSESACTRPAEYNTRTDALPGFSSLAPTTASLRWLVGNIGMITHADFWDVVARNVHIHRDTITRLHGHTAVLSSGAELQTDLVVACTGYKSTLPFISPTLKAHLGLPCPSTAIPPTTLTHWNSLEEKADSAILSRFPFLASAPSANAPGIFPGPEAAGSQPYRLYRGVLSPNAPLIVVGHVLHGNHFMSAEVQALWGVAALSGALQLPEKEAMEKDIAAFVAWARRRYPAFRDTANSVVFEGMGYVDALLREMGLTSHRGRGWWRDSVVPTLPRDLAGLVEEWRESCRKRRVSVEGDL